MYDVVIIGGGPSGLTAALYARRANKSVLILEKETFGGQITYSPKVENYPGVPSISGAGLADLITEQALAQGADAEVGTARRIERVEGGFSVVTDEGAYSGRSVIVAVGVRHRMLGLPGEDALVGHGISFCAVCDGAFYRGREVLVVGGGNSALQEALLLAENCSHVTVAQNLPMLTGEKRLQELLLAKENVTVLYETVVDGFEAKNGELSAVRLRRGDGSITRTTPQGVFIAIGLVPENAPFSEWAALDAQGYFDTDEDCRTATAGIFTAGDCRKKGVRQVTTAVADGAVAAQAACAYLDTLLNERDRT